MKKYLIEEIFSAHGYERTGLIKDLSNNKEIIVYFLSFDDYVEDIKEIKSIKKGDILEGRLFIVFVNKSMKINDEKNIQDLKESFFFKTSITKFNKIIYEQPIEKSSCIEAIVEVYRILNEDSIYVKSNISDRKILIEFENNVKYNKGDKVYIKGMLKIDDFKVIKS